LKRIPIACLTGDGTGPELIHCVRRVLDSLRRPDGPEIELLELPIGQAAYLKCGSALPQDTLSEVKKIGIALLGGIDVRRCPPPSPMGQLRRELGLYAEVRPVRSLGPGDLAKGKANLAIIRDLSEGFLSDRNMWKGMGEFMPSKDMALSVRVITRMAVERIGRFALKYMQAEGRKRMTLVHKTAVFRLTCGLFRDTVRELTRDALDLEITEGAVDEVAGEIVSDPGKFGVILTTNLFGDILSDVGAALVGGVVPSASFGEGVALFRPAHEALPELAGRGVINPVPTFLALAMALRWVGEEIAGGRVDRAAEQTVARLGLYATGLTKHTTGEVTDFFCGLLSKE
jgi:3-isopropylmalate dehydrogenase